MDKNGSSRKTYKRRKNKRLREGVFERGREGEGVFQRKREKKRREREMKVDEGNDYLNGAPSKTQAGRRARKKVTRVFGERG